MFLVRIWVRDKIFEVVRFTVNRYRVNYLDIAPQHASVIMGLSNTFATMAGICSPILTGYIVTTKVIYNDTILRNRHYKLFFQSPHEWQIVFCIASGIFVFGSIVYGIFASGEVQSWAVKSEVRKESQYDKECFEE